MEPFTIAVDFDGTIVCHKFPEIGEPVPMAIDTIKSWIDMGFRVILWTMRHDKYLDDAVRYCKEAGIEFYGVNENPSQGWSDSPKAYAHRYVDDMAIGCPLREYNGYKVVDWKKISELIWA